MVLEFVHSIYIVSRRPCSLVHRSNVQTDEHCDAQQLGRGQKDSLQHASFREVEGDENGHWEQRNTWSGEVDNIASCIISHNLAKRLW